MKKIELEKYKQEWKFLTPPSHAMQWVYHRSSLHNMCMCVCVLEKRAESDEQKIMRQVWLDEMWIQNAAFEIYFLLSLLAQHSHDKVCFLLVRTVDAEAVRGGWSEALLCRRNEIEFFADAYGIFSRSSYIFLLRSLRFWKLNFVLKSLILSRGCWRGTYLFLVCSGSRFRSIHTFEKFPWWYFDRWDFWISH